MLLKIALIFSEVRHEQNSMATGYTALLWLCYRMREIKKSILHKISDVWKEYSKQIRKADVGKKK